jgi:hypothetical protein
MPINIDLGMLAAAMHENRHGELGMHACLSGAAGGCPDGQRFNGVLSISASRGVPSSAPDGALIFPAGDGRQQKRLPWALCGTFTSDEASFERGEDPGLFTGEHFADCDDDNWAAIDAVRLVRGADLSAFAETGLTIVSDLPVYVQGDFNKVGSSVRMAIIAERVTFLSPSWKDGDRPPLGTHTTVPNGSAVNARVSLLTETSAPVGPIQGCRPCHRANDRRDAGGRPCHPVREPHRGADASTEAHLALSAGPVRHRHRRPAAWGAAGNLHPVVDPGALTVADGWPLTSGRCASSDGVCP